VHIYQIAAVLLFFSATLVWLAPRPRGDSGGGGGH
jgi:hypothetical protein